MGEPPSEITGWLVPFGGVKSSGLGKEGIKFSLAEMTEPKVISWYLPGV